jgi:hypothetical protein
LWESIREATTTLVVELLDFATHIKGAAFKNLKKLWGFVSFFWMQVFRKSEAEQQKVPHQVVLFPKQGIIWRFFSLKKRTESSLLWEKVLTDLRVEWT